MIFALGLFAGQEENQFNTFKSKNRTKTGIHFLESFCLFVLFCSRGGGTSIETLYGDVPPKWVGF